MGTSTRRRTKPRTGQTGPRIAITVVVLSALLSVWWVVTPHHLSRPVSVPADRYSGIIQLAPDDLGRCERFELDNKSGRITPSGAARCNDPPSPGSTASETMGSLGRLNGISGHFKPR